jgi:hypothetical protein
MKCCMALVYQKMGFITALWAHLNVDSQNQVSWKFPEIAKTDQFIRFARHAVGDTMSTVVLGASSGIIFRNLLVNQIIELCIVS